MTYQCFCNLHDCNFKGISNKELYQELGFESLKVRRRFKATVLLT